MRNFGQLRIACVLLLWCGNFACAAMRQTRQVNNCQTKDYYACHPNRDCDNFYQYECANIRLESLDINEGRYKKIICVNCEINYQLSHLRELYSLEITDSYLPNITMGLFNSLDTLDELTLTSSNISTVQYHSFGGLRVLRSLNLSFNSIRDIRLDDLSIYSNVETLDLSFNKIKDVTFPKTLVHFNLSQNELILTNRTFSGLNNLMFLDVSYNKLKHIPAHAFQDLIKLRTLDISCNDLLSFDYGDFSGLLQLTLLNVSFNSINNIPEYVLHDVANLESLYLNNNNLSEFNPKLVRENLRRLTSVGLHDNEWDCEYLSNIIRTFKQGGTEVLPGNYVNPPNIINICCTRSNTEQTISTSGDSVDANNVLRTLNTFFNRDFVNSKFYNFFTKDYRQQNFWKYFDADFKRGDLFRFFDVGFSQSQFYRYFNRDYFNATVQHRIIDKIDDISPGGNDVNVTELKDTLKSMFGDLFRTLNASNEVLPESDRLVVQSEYSYKDVLIGVMATVIILLVLYFIYQQCGAKKTPFDKLKLYQMFRSKTSTVNETDVEIL